MKLNRTHSIKKCSVNSLDANDRSKKILINSVFVFLKVDKFNQYLIQVFNRSIRQDHLKTFQQRAITTHLASQSTISYNFHLSRQNCTTEWAHFNVAKIKEIDSLSQLFWDFKDFVVVRFVSRRQLMCLRKCFAQHFVVCTVDSHLAHQSTITYDFYSFNQNCKTEWAHFNVSRVIEIDSLSQ